MARIGRFINLADDWVRRRYEQVRKAREEQVMDGGLWAYIADDAPLDGGLYDDPHKPREKRPIVDDDLEGWEPLR